jgi:hypothetical protein
MRLAYLVVALGGLGCGKDISSVTPDAEPAAPDTNLPNIDANLTCAVGPGVTTVSGNIAANTTWSDTVNITGTTTIKPGVVVTVMPCTNMNGAATSGLLVQGTLDIQGTNIAPVLYQDLGGYGIHLPPGGVLTTHYYVQVGSGIHLTGGSATLIDTRMSHSDHDFLTMGGGTVDVEYSAIGVEPGEGDTTHCDMHFGAGGNVIKVTHSNLSTSVYGIMFYSGQGADFTYNNWFSNTVDIALQTGSPVSGDFSFSWFAKGVPNKPGVTVNNPASARLADAGPRP